MVRDILLLGDERLYEPSEALSGEDWDMLPGWAGDLHDTLLAYRAKYGAGRAVASEQNQPGGTERRQTGPAER